MWSEWQSSPANPIWSRSQLCPSSASCANECQRFAAFFRCSPFRLALCLGPWIKTTKDPAISKSIFGVVSLDDGNVGISRKSLNHLKSINAIIRLSFFFLHSTSSIPSMIRCNTTVSWPSLGGFDTYRLETKMVGVVLRFCHVVKSELCKHQTSFKNTSGHTTSPIQFFSGQFFGSGFFCCKTTIQSEISCGHL